MTLAGTADLAHLAKLTQEGFLSRKSDNEQFRRVATGDF